jgi:hypothetical protein
VNLSDSKLAEHLVDEFLMVGLVLFIIFEGLFQFLHFDPLVKRTDHLCFLFVDAF